eukprot:5070934-Lingulodinium_polyedra.AAC.1
MARWHRLQGPRGFEHVANSNYRTKTWRIVTYNPGSTRQAGRWDDIVEELQTVRVWGLQGTRHRTPSDFEVRRRGQFTCIDWGWGNGKYTNRSAGVTIGLNRKLFNPQ